MFDKLLSWTVQRIYPLKVCTVKYLGNAVNKTNEIYGFFKTEKSLAHYRMSTTVIEIARETVAELETSRNECMHAPREFALIRKFRIFTHAL